MIWSARTRFLKRRLQPVLAALTLCLCGSSVRAQDLVSGLSTDLIQITSNFNGTDIVMFGAIEAMGEITASKDQDLVIVIRGPPVDMTVRRKERVFGVWINREQIQLSGMPGYYFLASTRPIDDIATLPTLQRFRLGTANLEANVRGASSPEEAVAFRAAAVRDLKREHLYWESPTRNRILQPNTLPRPNSHSGCRTAGRISRRSFFVSRRRCGQRAIITPVCRQERFRATGL